jgi:hypothetical protein
MSPSSGDSAEWLCNAAFPLGRVSITDALPTARWFLCGMVVWLTLTQQKTLGMSLAIPSSACCLSTLSLEIEFHLDPGQFNHIVFVQLVWLTGQRLAIHQREIFPFDMGNEETIRTTSQDRNLHARLA